MQQSGLMAFHSSDGQSDKHTVKVTQTLLKAINQNNIQCPSQLPDLNLIKPDLLAEN